MLVYFHYPMQGDSLCQLSRIKTCARAACQGPEKKPKSRSLHDSSFAFAHNVRR